MKKQASFDEFNAWICHKLCLLAGRAEYAQVQASSFKLAHIAHATKETFNL